MATPHLVSVNVGLPKTLIQHVIRWVIAAGEVDEAKDVLQAVLDTEISPELVPADAQVEMEAKKAAGYFTPGDVKKADELKKVKGRGLDE